MQASTNRRIPARQFVWLLSAVLLLSWSASALPAAPPSLPSVNDFEPSIPSAAQRAIQPGAPELPSMADGEADDDRWAGCPPTAPRHQQAQQTEIDSIDLHADSAESSPDNVYTLKGNAIIQYGSQEVSADHIVYREATGELDASGTVRLTAAGLEVDAQHASIQTEQYTGTLEQLEYALPGLHASGSARELKLKGREHQQLMDASYTTCHGTDPDWLLTADEVELDHAAGRGTARGAKLEFKGIPIAYLPYMSFPTEKRRKSGLLTPGYSQSNETGTDISLPYYLDIAPNYDAIIVPRYMSDRGLMLGGEFRYLHAKNRGEIRAEFLDADKRLEQRERSLFSVNHSGRPLPRLGVHLNASSVSDEEYFEDLGTTIVQTSQTSLERSAGIDWQGDEWGAEIVVQDFQNIDPMVASVDRAYKQLPRVSLYASPSARPLGLKFSAFAEFNSFDHSDGDRVTGKRVDLQPRISLPWYRTAWYLEPALSVRHTRYDLDGVDSGADASPARTTPVLSIDAGSFFERNTHWGEHALVQTLEPRAFYLYVPEKNQDDIPLFDTGSYDLNYWALFRENRFTGPDRMNDANQVALAVTTRLLDPDNGRQILSASLGSLVYFRDRKVTLPGEASAVDDSSDLISEITMDLGNSWNAHAELQWNPHASQTSRNNLRLQYKPGQRQIVNASYRRRPGRQEQADLSFLWPLTPSWHMVGRWYYSLDANRTIEAIAGLGYDSCCWGARLVGRSYINDAGNNRNTAVLLQLELKGLGATGKRVDDVLERGILGYQPRN